MLDSILSQQLHALEDQALLMTIIDSKNCVKGLLLLLILFVDLF